MIDITNSINIITFTEILFIGDKNDKPWKDKQT